MPSTTETVYFDDGKDGGEDFEVEFYYSIDPGVRTFSNGDPGYPPSYEMEVYRITGFDGRDMISQYNDDDKFRDFIDNALWRKVTDEEA